MTESIHRLYSSRMMLRINPTMGYLSTGERNGTVRPTVHLIPYSSLFVARCFGVALGNDSRRVFIKSWDNLKYLNLKIGI